MISLSLDGETTLDNALWSEELRQREGPCSKGAGTKKNKPRTKALATARNSLKRRPSRN